MQENMLEIVGCLLLIFIIIKFGLLIGITILLIGVEIKKIVPVVLQKVHQ